jgi:hypothetical protein
MPFVRRNILGSMRRGSQRSPESKSSRHEASKGIAPDTLGDDVAQNWMTTFRRASDMLRETGEALSRFRQETRQ